MGSGAWAGEDVAVAGLMDLSLSPPLQPVITEDFSHLPPEQRRKKLQQKIEERNRELQKEVDQRDALNKMKDVYQRTPQMGDPNSLEPKISETLGNIERLRLEIQKYESWLTEAESRMLSNRPDNMRYSRHLDPATTVNNNNSSHEKDRWGLWAS
uniref:REM-1 domain-containing protein n=1 Tax=Sphenodon punctatus TaxID=8508 RepID=A0A8D0GWC4_SPHPU